MSDDDLIRRGDVTALQDRFMGVVHVEKIAALPAVVPGVRVPTDAQVNSACLSYRHDFGLLQDQQREMVRFEAKEWLIAWQKALPAALDTPAPAMELVGALRAFKAFDDLPAAAKRPDVFEQRVRQPILAVLAKIGGAS